MQSIFDNMSRFVLDIFYPNRCPCCDGFIKWDELVCDECRAALENMEDENFCSRCGRNPCICNDAKLFYDEIYIYRPYLDKSRSGVLSMKNGNNKNYGEYSGKRLAEMLSDTRADMIIPVPMAKRRKRIRGYNQAEIIAAEISAETGIILRKDILFMRYSKTEQHSKNTAERKNIADYIYISEDDISGMSVIICDDIITTGNTFNACARLLKDKGAKKVTAAAAAGTVYRV